MNELPYKSSFASIIKCVIGEEKDKYLSLASFENLRDFIPVINAKNIDLLPISFDACVVNRGNKNGDIIDTETALSIYKTFIHKFIDSEHNRHHIVGVILTAGLSKFGTNEPLTEDDVRGKDEPFNITLGGVLWRAANPKLCDVIEESNDPSSSNYMGISSSWELGFSGYKIVEMEETKDKNISDGSIITDPETIEKIDKYLKCNGGSGVKNNKSYYRLPNKDVIAMGIGITEKPAADVVGIATNVELEEKSQTKDKNETQGNIMNKEKNTEIISQDNKNDVNERRKVNMKITSISDLTDENLKQCTASAITDFIAAEITKGDASWQKEKREQATANETLKASTVTLQGAVEEMKASLQALQKEKADRDAVDTFNSRMTEISASYELPADVAKVVAEDLKGLTSSESFAAWKSRADVLLKSYSKASLEAIAKKKEEDDKKNKEAKEKSESEAKTKEDKDKADKADKEKKDKESMASVIDDAIDNGTKEKGGIPNTSSAVAPNLKEKFKQAFAEENFIIK